MYIFVFINIKTYKSMKNVKIEIPKGYEIDEEKSTFKLIVFKEVEKAPEYVECVHSRDDRFYIGEIVKVLDYVDGKFNLGRGSTPRYLYLINGREWSFKPSTKEAYEEQQKKAEMDELLEEAKRRYPVGTRFITANTAKGDRIVTSHDVYEFTFVHKAINLIASGGDRSCQGGSVYNNGKWAEIIPEAKEMTVAEISKALGYKVKVI